MSAPRYAAGVIRDRAFVWAVEYGDHVHSRRPDGVERCHRPADRAWCTGFAPGAGPALSLGSVATENPGEFNAAMMFQVAARLRENHRSGVRGLGVAPRVVP